MTITPIYASFAALLFVFLSARVIGMRRRDKISLGDADNAEMRKRIRVHGNFAEYAPLGLLLLALAELQSAPLWALHFVGVTLLVGRMLHAFGVSKTPQIMNFRVVGMVLTFVSLIIGAATNLGVAVT